jgi:transcriptional regulator with XRE-family HTH domain
MDLVTLGQRLRHLRRAKGMTLDQLSSAVGRAPSQLSLIENGKREPRLSLLQAIASALGVPLQDLLRPEAPSRRAGLEIELAHFQAEPAYAALGLPVVRGGRRLPADALESLVGLHREVARRAAEQVATPEEAAALVVALAMGRGLDCPAEIEDQAAVLLSTFAVERPDHPVALYFDAADDEAIEAFFVAVGRRLRGGRVPVTIQLFLN